MIMQLLARRSSRCHFVGGGKLNLGRRQPHMRSFILLSEKVLSDYTTPLNRVLKVRGFDLVEHFRILTASLMLQLLRVVDLLQRARR